METWTRRSILLGMGGAIGSAAFPVIGRAAQSGNFGVVVYGATPSGIMAAYAAAREGASVALVMAGAFGGMCAQGLGWSDTGKIGVVGGLCMEFFRRVARLYNPTSTSFVKNFEPHIAEQAFRAMIREAGVTTIHVATLAGVAGSARKIQSIQLTDGTVLTAQAFVDASYEGDLMAAARCACSVGRESSTRFNEPNAGFDAIPANHHVPTRDSRGNLFPIIKPYPAQARFTADRAVQCYTFRLCVSNDPANKAAFPKPPGYDADRYGFELALLASPNKDFSPAPVGHSKFDVNGNYFGGPWDWAEGNAARRRAIFTEHYNYQAGLLYFYANDPRVPSAFREQVNQYGLAKDEFVGTGNWPRQLYIREARRLSGRYVMTQGDAQTAVTKLHPVGMGSYSLDSHAPQVLEIKNGYMDYEGTFGTIETRGTTPYQIPYESLLPKEYDNLLVSVCVSASHVAYASVRMEPQYMIMGEAAGCAAALVAQRRTISIALAAEITSKVQRYGAVMAYTVTAAAKAADGAGSSSPTASSAAADAEPERAVRLDPLY
ncbi:FAD-dependent oxidoreductase [Inquilinus limosus]|uniref:Xanthan lyase n=1 Tax=Inquilinus limosus TaxID=171674 RepID=A0A211Z6F7_9PROT|nr:FAD-dependent oxidoreductase [Inquilinus limosus]OWJ60842.1 hypothetical protein BWR60_31610 [Inquilinus limosus]